MTADLHIHTKFSADSEAEPRAQIEAAIAKGADILCFTDHMDYDFGAEGNTFTFDPDRYFDALVPLQKAYREDIQVLIGVEFGMQPHLRNQFEALLRGWPFDYILGSQHLVFGKDPYYPDVFRKRRDLEVIEEWFRELKECLLCFPEISALAHIDYIFRYLQEKEKQYAYETFSEEIGSVLSILIREGISLEINTGGFRKIRAIPLFHQKLLDQYQKMGGKRIVTGSDAHEPKNILIDYVSLNTLFAGREDLTYTYYEKLDPKTLNL